MDSHAVERFAAGAQLDAGVLLTAGVNLINAGAEGIAFAVEERDLEAAHVSGGAFQERIKQQLLVGEPGAFEVVVTLMSDGSLEVAEHEVCLDPFSAWFGTSYRRDEGRVILQCESPTADHEDVLERTSFVLHEVARLGSQFRDRHVSCWMCSSEGELSYATTGTGYCSRCRS